ncbi:MAG TPA: type 1 glutamine amidotransferase [Burkholderiaceae bacterium]|nr:type 1 glutamine amidotransferase [Burkholderiaceae bacterium]
MSFDQPTVPLFVKPIAILQYYEHDGVGFFGEHVRARGVAARVFELFNGDMAPASLEGFGALCLMGGPMSANDHWGPLRDGERLILEGLRTNVPVFGHCLGGQLMSRALGGQVSAAPYAEIGWSRIDAQDDPLARHWFGRAAFPMFQWHNETFSVPPTARLIATGDYCRHQAFAIGHLHIGVQFHCEMDRGQIESWLRVPESADIDRYASSPAVQRPETIRTETDSFLTLSQQTAAHIYDRWLERIAT